MKYLSVTKPGIIFGNVITLCGGYFLASQHHFDFLRLIITIISMALVIASGCVFNNIIDRDIDQKMERTKSRPLAKNLISVPVAFVYALFLGLAGLALFYWGTNVLTTMVALVGLVVYVGAYSLWLKRNSVHGTVIGGIAGAIPPVVGYCAVTNRLDLGALLLFLILFFWQIPHAYAIAIYRQNEFELAALPLLPIKKGTAHTKRVMLFYMVLTLLAAISPTVFGFTGWVYFAVACLLGIGWIYKGIKGFSADNDQKWAKKVFLFSILNITLLCLLMWVRV